MNEVTTIALGVIALGVIIVLVPPYMVCRDSRNDGKLLLKLLVRGEIDVARVEIERWRGGHFFSLRGCLILNA